MPVDASAFARRLAHAPTDGARGRYAPSPTGPLHLGNVRSALLAWLQARLDGATFVMRMEDLDTPRCVDGSAEQILDDLRWLGLDWDEGPDMGGAHGPYEQGVRGPIYDDALATLEAHDRVFPCWCSRRDIREASSAPHGRSPVYPGTCRGLDAAGRAQMAAEKPDRTPSWRFRVGGLPPATAHDVLHGDTSQDLAAEVGDFVVRRADGLYAYQLAVVVDDALMGVTDVVRGDDLLDSSPRQVALFEALGAPAPRFWHVPLMRDGAGERMSKRDGSESLAERRAAGDEPADVVGALAASVGLAEPGARTSAAELLDALDPAVFRRVLRTAASDSAP